MLPQKTLAKQSFRNADLNLSSSPASDFDLLLKKKQLGGPHFESEDDVTAAVDPLRTPEEGIYTLGDCCMKYVNVGGDYVQKINK